MKTGFALDYPWWMLLICIAVGLVFSLLLYFKNKKNQYNFNWIPKLLGLLRFATVTSICFLLLSMVFKHFTSQVEKPIIIIAHDNSASIKLGFKNLDSTAYRKSIEQLTQKLSSKYEVKNYTFGNKLSTNSSLDYSQPATDMANAISELYNLYDNQNIGAVVLASDGIINKGQDPNYFNQFKVPFYTIALGDTTTQKDLKIENVFANKTVYLGDKSSVQIAIAANQCKGSETKITLQQLDGGNKTISQQNISINNENFKFQTNYTIDADKPGLHHYRATVEKIDGELTTANNARDFYIEVIDEKQKILLLSNAPHPDIAAIKEACESLKNYEVTANYIMKFNGSTAGYDMVILHNLPSTKYPINNLINEINANSISTLYIVGTQTNLPAFGQAQNLLKISGNNTINEITSATNANFVAFTTDATEMNALESLPALLAPFGNYILSGDAKVLLSQKIGAITTKNPLLCYQDNNGKKTGIWCGENIWKWKMANYQKYNNHIAINNLITKSIQYLTVKQNKNPFRINVSKNTYLVNEIVHFEAELYNESKELINESEVKITITDAFANQDEYVLNKNAKSYYLDINNLNEGSYGYTANTQLNGKTYTAQGTFNISGLELESITTQANHSLLYKLSSNTSGQLFYPRNTAALADTLLNNAKIKPVLYSQFTTSPIINLKWIFFLLLLLLSTEWLIRKYNGAY